MTIRWCEDHHVDYVMGLANNDAQSESAEAMTQAEAEFTPGDRRSRISDRTRPTRAIVATEFLEKGANPRSSPVAERLGARALYEDFYCARGDMENRIKEQQLGLFADRTSAATMRANQLRLYLSSAAYMLMHALRRLGLKQTPLARAQCQTIRLKLLKIGAQMPHGPPRLDLHRKPIPQRGRRSKPPGHSSALLRSVPIKRPQKERSLRPSSPEYIPSRSSEPVDAPFTNTTASLDLDRIDSETLRKPFRPAKITFISKSVIYAG